MSPHIALFLYCIFVVIVFKLDKTGEKKVSRTLWIPLIWFIILGSRALSQWINWQDTASTTQDYLEGNPLNRYFYLGIEIIGAIALLRRNIQWNILLKRNAWIVILMVYSLVSLSWSEYPYVSFKRWVKEIGNVIMILLVLTERYPVESFKVLIRRFAYLMVPLSIVFIKYYPHLGRSYSPYTGEAYYHGVSVGKNGLGNLALTCGIFFAWSLLVQLKNRGTIPLSKRILVINAAYFAMVIWLFYKADSATSLLCFLIGITMLVGMNMSIVRNKSRYFSIYVIFLVSLFVMLQVLLNITQAVIIGLGRDLTLTSRTIIWRDVIALVTDPVFGTGYNSFWLGQRLTIMWDKYWWMPTEAHNGYIETYIELGYVGVGILAAIIISGYRKITRELQYDYWYGTLLMTFFTITLVYNIAESAFKGLHPRWFIFLLIITDIARENVTGNVYNWSEKQERNSVSSSW